MEFGYLIFRLFTLMNGKAMYIKPTSLLMPVGYKSKNVLYLHSKKLSHNMINSVLYIFHEEIFILKFHT